MFVSLKFQILRWIPTPVQVSTHLETKLSLKKQLQEAEASNLEMKSQISQLSEKRDRQSALDLSSQVNHRMSQKGLPVMAAVVVRIKKS